MTVRVLCPLDGSTRSLEAARAGLAMLQGADVAVTLFCVQHAGFDDAPEDLVQAFDEDEGDEVFPTLDSANRMLAQAQQELGLPEARLVCVEGNVYKQILQAAAEHDLLVMHALDKSGLLEKLRMSGVERLARQAPCSILLVAD